MIRLILISILLTIITGCAKRETREISGSYTLPPGLQDCSVFKLSTNDVVADDIVALRCPNSSTAVSNRVSQGKTTRVIRTVVIDGVTYEEKVNGNEDP